MASPATTAAGNASDVPGIARDPKGGIFRRTAHRKFVHVQPAKNNRPGGLQLFDDRGVVGRDKFSEDFRATVQRLVFDGEHVLDRNRYAEQGFLLMRRAGGQGLVGGISLRQCIGGIVADEGMDRSVHARNLVET